MERSGSGEEIPIGQELGHHREARQDNDAGEEAAWGDAPDRVDQEDEEEIEIGNEIGRDSDRSG